MARRRQSSGSEWMLGSYWQWEEEPITGFEMGRNLVILWIGIKNENDGVSWTDTRRCFWSILLCF